MSQLIYQANADWTLQDGQRNSVNSAADAALWAVPPHTLFNDCGMIRPSSTYAGSAAAHTLYPHPGLLTLPLDSEYVVACVPSCSQVAVLGQTAQNLLAQLPLAHAPLDPQTMRMVTAMQRLGLLTSAAGPLAPHPAASALIAWLHVTNACNLRCHYCYLQKNREMMSTVTAYAAIDTVIRSACRHGYREVVLKYAGGEATLALDMVAGMQRYAQTQAAHHGLQLHAGILSNGTTLTPDRLARIKALGLQLAISLDGLDQVHDMQRPTIGGQGSFAATQRGVEQALHGGIVPGITMTVTAKNIDSLPELVEWLLEHNLPFNISFYRPHLHNTSPEQLQIDEEHIIVGMRRVYAEVQQHLPRWSVLGALLDRTDLSAAHQRACAAGEDYLVIDQHGQIAKCHMTIDQPVTHVETDDPLTLLRDDQIGTQNLPVDQKSACRTCSWRYWCGGGCPVATYRATGRYDLKAPNCRIYKSLYPDLLRLEGLRLLHWYRARPSHKRTDQDPPSVL
jgi:uncharacterized protein